jgi:ankyrin repeat protein
MHPFKTVIQGTIIINVFFVTLFIFTITLHSSAFYNELIEEAKEGNLQKVKELIANGANINVRDESGFTPLLMAATRGHKDTTKFLIAKGANLNARSDLGFTLLMFVSEKGWKDIAELLISKGTDVNAKTKNEFTALMAASGNGQKEMAEFLIFMGAKINVMADTGFTPLKYAVYYGHKEVAELLISNGAIINSKDLNYPDVLMIALRRGHKDVAILLISKGADVNTIKGDDTLLTEALGKGFIDVAELLIANGVDVNIKKYGIPLLYYYIKFDKRDEVVRFLVSKGADIKIKDKNGMDALMHASARGNKDIVEFLISKGADINAVTKSPPGYHTSDEGATPIIYASSNGHKELVEFLISKGADVNAKKTNGYTALISAISLGHTDIAKLLVTKGANVNVAEVLGNTPLLLALEKKQIEVANLLIANGADFNVKNKKGVIVSYLKRNNDAAAEFLMDKGADINSDLDGITPLMFVAENGRRVLAEQLISRGAKVDARNERGETALMLASAKGHKELVELLISKGAYVNAKNNYGKTPLRIAKEEKQREIEKLLISKGGREGVQRKFISYSLSGNVIDKDTSLPIEEVVLVRSWDRVVVGPGGSHNVLLAFDETLTDKDGKFIFSPWPATYIDLHITYHIPLISWTAENRLIAFKSGYKFLILDKKDSVIEMERVPSIYYLRHEVVEEAKRNYEIDFYETKLLKDVIEQEEGIIKKLPKFIHGVFFTRVSSANDIDFDKEGKVYISDNSSIWKTSEDGEQLEITKGSVLLQILSSYNPIDIEFDQDGSLYALSKNNLMKISFSKKMASVIQSNDDGKSGAAVIKPQMQPIKSFEPHITYLFPKKDSKFNLPRDVDMKFTIGANQRLYIIIPRSNKLKAFNSDGELWCVYEHQNKNIKFIDIASDKAGYILVSYSFGPVMEGGKYVDKGGILKLSRDCKEIHNFKVDIDGKEAKGIDTTAEGNVIVANNNSFYIFDSNFKLIFSEDMSTGGLGNVNIVRIKSNKQEGSLYIIDNSYRRILKYNIRDRKWHKSKNKD